MAQMVWDSTAGPKKPPDPGRTPRVFGGVSDGDALVFAWKCQNGRGQAI